MVLLIRRSAAIYAESNRQLGPVTEEKIVPAGFDGWLTLNFYSASSLSSGSSYSLVVWFKGSQCSVWYSSGSAGQSWYANQAYGGFWSGPYSSFAAYGQENNVYSILLHLRFSFVVCFWADC